MNVAASHLDLPLDEPLNCRLVWISDVHLGTRHARVAELLDFLCVVDCKYVYLVGDLIDRWEWKFRWFWRDDYNVLVQKLLRKSRKQTQVIYISGNQDGPGRLLKFMVYRQCAQRLDCAVFSGAFDRAGDSGTVDNPGAREQRR